MKELSTYGYKIQIPLTISISINSGYLYIIANDPMVSESKVILKFKHFSPLRDSLIRIIHPKCDLN